MPREFAHLRLNKKILGPFACAALVWLLLASPAFADIIYTVEEGDSAWSIAVHFGVSLEALYEANGWASDENPVLGVGQRIAIPSDSDKETSDVEGEGSPEDDESEEPRSETTHIVQPGENPWMIAHRFGIGTLALLEFNGLSESDLIHPGQLLSIPPGDYQYQGNAEVEAGEEEDAPEPIHYEVKPGDNPWMIARQFGLDLQTLLAYNDLDTSTILHAGDQLLIPAGGVELSSRSLTQTTHTVARGETLSGIASRYGVPLAALFEANNLTSTSTLRVGQEVMVPGYRSGPPPTAESETESTPPTPPRAEDLSEVLEPLPRIGIDENGEGGSGWHSEIFDFTRIATPEPSTPDPEEAGGGGLSVDGHFSDGTPYHLYAVRRGDTISEVAHAFGVTQSELTSRNGLDMRSMLRIGRDLRIPLPRPASSGGGGRSFGAPDVAIGGGDGTERGRRVVEEAMRHQGTPYVWSGTNLESGVDCSGFTMSVFAQFGVNLPHRSRDQADCGSAVEYEDLLPGDLVCFHTTRSGISHVGIYIGNGEFIHSSSHRGGVVINRIDTGYYSRRFVCARRLL